MSDKKEKLTLENFDDLAFDLLKRENGDNTVPVSYTHLTLPTKLEV